MKLRFLLLLIFWHAVTPADGATVLTNASGTPGISQLVKGPGGFISQPISLGFEFTISHPDDWSFLSLSLNVASNTAASPLLVELYGSPAGPDTATLISALSGPSTPTPGAHTWTAVTPITLHSGDTYFVKVSVPAGAGSYGFSRTAEPVTGDWTLDAHYTQAGAVPWNVSAGDAPMFTITAVPEPSVVAALALFAGSMLLVRRRRTPVAA